MEAGGSPFARGPSPTGPSRPARPPRPGQEGEAWAVSGEEVRELLAPLEGGPGGVSYRDPESERAPAAVVGKAGVLLISRRAADVELVRACLDEAGAAVRVARNPFTALDHLRVEPPDAVISDLDLWADTGSLLFERIGRLGRAVPVLFLGDRALGRPSELEDRAVRAGAEGIIFRPLRPGELESATRALLASARAREPAASREDPSRADPAQKAAPGADPAQEPAPKPAREPAQEPSQEDGTPLDDLPSPAGQSFTPWPPEGAATPQSQSVPPELPWLRFHHKACRLLRSGVGADALARDLAMDIVELAREELAPSALGLLYRPDGPCGRTLGILESSPGDDPPPFERLLQALETGFLVEFGSPGRGGRLILAGLSAAVREAGHPFSADLSHLLGELLGR